MFDNFDPEKQRIVDCDELAKHTVTLTITGKDLKNICTGLSLFDQISKQYEDLPVCEDCQKANRALFKLLTKELDRVSEL